MPQEEFPYKWWIQKFTPLLGSIFAAVLIIMAIRFFEAAAKFKLLAGIMIPIILGIGVASSLLRMTRRSHRTPPHNQ